jgi:hypothetical protein
MNDPYARYHGRSDVVVIPRIRVTFAASILVHVAALMILLPRLPLLSPGFDEPQATDRLQVQLTAPPEPKPAQPIPPSPAAPETRAIMTARARPRSAPPRDTPPQFVVPRTQVPNVVVPPPPAPPAGEPPKTFPPAEGDLASARRGAARAARQSESESESELCNRIIASVCRRRKARWAASRGSAAAGSSKSRAWTTTMPSSAFWLAQGRRPQASAGDPGAARQQQRHAHRHRAQDDRAHPRD